MKLLETHRLQHIIWDWNGTLLDDLQICVEIINSLLAERGLRQVSSSEYREIFGFPVKNYYQRLGFDFSQEPFETISTLFITAYEKRRSSCGLMPGASDTLLRISRSGITQSILSASKKTYLDQAVKDYRIGRYFLLVDGLDDHHAAGKLSLAEEHLASLPYSPGRILLVGDTLHDAEIAHHLQTQCCLIPNGHQSLEKLLSTGCQIEYSLADLSANFEIK